jgi:hypothetical protein
MLGEKSWIYSQLHAVHGVPGRWLCQKMRGNGGQNIQSNSEVFIRQLLAKSCPACRRGQPDVCLRSNLVSLPSRPLVSPLADKDDVQLRTMATNETSPLLDTAQDITATGDPPASTSAAPAAPADFIVWNPPSNTLGQTSRLGKSRFAYFRIF